MNSVLGVSANSWRPGYTFIGSTSSVGIRSAAWGFLAVTYSLYGCSPLEVLPATAIPHANSYGGLQQLKKCITRRGLILRDKLFCDYVFSLRGKTVKRSLWRMWRHADNYNFCTCPF